MQKFLVKGNCFKYTFLIDLFILIIINEMNNYKNNILINTIKTGNETHRPHFT